MAAYTRRAFAGFCTAAVAFVGFGGAVKAADGAAETSLVRPPGAQDELRLLASCVKCDRCRSVCHTGVIGVAEVGDGVLRARTPKLNFHRGSCDFCGDCLRVCPTGAIGPFDPDVDKMGVAVVQKDRCVAYYQGMSVRGDLAGRQRPPGGGRRPLQRVRRVRGRMPGARVPQLRRRLAARHRGGEPPRVRAAGEDGGGGRARDEREMKRNSNLLRTLSALAVIALACVGLALHTGTGTPSAWGVFDVAALCPLGAVEAALASKTVVPPMLIALAVGVVLVVLFGRAFCAWGCPIPLLRRIFGLKEPKRTRRPSNALDLPASQRGGAADSRNWVLGGALLSTAVFGFPVFCLICPVGLTFATLIAVWRLFQFNEVALSLWVFPAILVLEGVVPHACRHVPVSGDARRSRQGGGRDGRGGGR